MDKSATPDYYEALQISPAAQSLIVTKAYRLLAAFYHPDNKETGDAAAFRNVVEAHRVLSDPVRRAAYDREKFGMLSSPPTEASPLCESQRSDGRRTSVSYVVSCCRRSTTSAAP